VRVGELLLQAWREVNPSVPVMLGDIIDEQAPVRMNNRHTEALST
jgi:hypothetical protein